MLNLFLRNRGSSPSQTMPDIPDIPQVIYVVLGLRNPGEELAAFEYNRHSRASATQLETPQRIQIVEYYYAKHRRLLPRTPGLRKIEKAVESELKTRGVTHKSVAKILFVQSNQAGESIDLPFRTDSVFLHLAGGNLFQKLSVYQYSSDFELSRQWKPLLNAGMRVIPLNGKRGSILPTARLAATTSPIAGAPFTMASESRGPTPVLESPRRPSTTDFHTSSSAQSLHSPSSTTIASEEETPLAVYTTAALEARRLAYHAVILLVGHSGHGKSKTINRLMGQNLLPIGRTTLGSTTKVIQRVKLPAFNVETGVTITVAFDDTPGLEDTNHNDRLVNANLIRRYKQQCFSNGTYPNIILLVAAWDSITPDAHNDPEHFTSAVGKSMHSLSSSGLVDEHRCNVVVVVTKSLSSWDQFDDFETMQQKEMQWNIEAGRRAGIIADLQRRMFPHVADWPTVFIENGGGRDMGAKYPTLPNGELSHQNLFQTMYKIIGNRGDKGTVRDLAGWHALDVLSGDNLGDLASQTTTEILVGRSSESVSDLDILAMNAHPPLRRGRIQELTDSYLGVMYNPVRGTFGRTRILENPLSPSFRDDLLARSSKLQWEEEDIQQERGYRLSPDPATLRTHYSSSSALQSAVSAQSQCYTLRSIIEVVEIEPSELRLSSEMQDALERLPQWSPQNKQEYHEFLAMYGTHIVTRIALGGILRVIVNSADETSDHSGDVRSTYSNITILRDGGGSVAAELTYALEYLFSGANSPQWPKVCTEWINDLERDPVFCPDDPLTRFELLCNVPGLSNQQKNDLRFGIESYLQAGYRSLELMSPRRVGTPARANSLPLPRTENRRMVNLKLIQGFKSFYSKYSPGWKRLRNIIRDPASPTQYQQFHSPLSMGEERDRNGQYNRPYTHS